MNPEPTKFTAAKKKGGQSTPVNQETPSY